MHPPLNDLPRQVTERLVIEPLSSKHARAVQVLTDDQSITAAIDFLPSPFSLADAEALIRGNDDDNCFLGVWLDKALIGVIGAHTSGVDHLEIGYWLGTEFQGVGYAAEAAASVTAQLVRIYPTHSITAECRPDNRPSWSLLHKLGFLSVGIKGKRAGRALLVRQPSGTGTS